MNNEQKPEYVPKRPLYKSYNEIITTLVRETVSRIKQEPQEELKPVQTAKMIELRRRVLNLRLGLKGVEKRLRDMNVMVEDHGKNELAYTYEYRRRQENAPRQRRLQRLEKVQQEKIKATLDTIDMTPTQAKQYLLKLERRLSKV